MESFWELIKDQSRNKKKQGLEDFFSSYKSINTSCDGWTRETVKSQTSIDVQYTSSTLGLEEIKTTFTDY